MCPLPGANVIPGGWSSHHAPAARGGMNATVTVGAKTGTTEVDDDVVVTYSEIYTGPARIQALNQARQTELAGESLAGRAYLVQIDFSAFGVGIGMRVKVTAAPNDPDLAGQSLWVVDPQMGSERFTRDMVCSDDQTDTSA